MRWPRLVTSLVLVGGLVLVPGPAASQEQQVECQPAEVATVGTIELKSQESGRIEGDAGRVIPIAGYDFKVERAVDAAATRGGATGVDAAHYAPLRIQKPVDAATDALAAAAGNDEDLSEVVLTVNGSDGGALLTYRFGLARIVSQTTSAATPCEMEEVRLRVGIVHITHEPSGESVIDSGATDF